MSIIKKRSYIYRDIVKEIEGGAKLIDGATDFFKFLIKKNIPFTISSASIKENIDFFIKTFKLDSFFDVSTIVYDDGRFNNKGQMYKESLKVMNFIPEETLIFEDSITGIKGAYEAGVKDVIAIYNENLLNRYKEFPLKKIVTNYNNLSDLF
ncbi:MAG: HAD hydrolase-like protein [Erysipelotrichaceae bacterium]